MTIISSIMKRSPIKYENSTSFVFAFISAFWLTRYSTTLRWPFSAAQ